MGAYCRIRVQNKLSLEKLLYSKDLRTNMPYMCIGGVLTCRLPRLLHLASVG